MPPKNLPVQDFLTRVGLIVLVPLVTWSFAISSDTKVNTKRLDLHDEQVKEVKELIRENNSKTQDKLDYIIQELNKKADR